MNKLKKYIKKYKIQKLVEFYQNYILQLEIHIFI